MKQIKDFPSYFITRDGEVFSNATGEMVRLNPYPRNSHSHPSVSLYRGGEVVNKYVKDLVYETFIAPTSCRGIITCLDGDVNNVKVDNLCQVGVKRGYSRNVPRAVPVDVYYRGVLQYECDSVAHASMLLGISRPTIYNMLRNNYTFRRCYVEKHERSYQLFYNGSCIGEYTSEQLFDTFHINKKILNKQLRKANIFMKDWKIVRAK